MHELLLSLFAPLRRAGVAVFKSDLQLRRADNRVRIVLQERWTDPTKPRPQSREEIEAERGRTELALMKEQLAALLNDLPEARQTLRHLVFVEHALQKKGLRALHKLPLEMLEHGLAQLESLVTNWSPTGLASLRSKMAVALIDREHMDSDAEGDGHRTSAVLDTNIYARSPHDDELAAERASEQIAEQIAEQEDAALAAAYAALAPLPPAALEFQAELGSPSARAVTQAPPRLSSVDVELDLRELAVH